MKKLQLLLTILFFCNTLSAGDINIDSNSTKKDEILKIIKSDNAMSQRYQMANAKYQKIMQAAQSKSDQKTINLIQAYKKNLDNDLFDCGYVSCVRLTLETWDLDMTTGGYRFSKYQKNWTQELISALQAELKGGSIHG